MFPIQKLRTNIQVLTFRIFCQKNRNIISRGVARLVALVGISGKAESELRVYLEGCVAVYTS